MYNYFVSVIHARIKEREREREKRGGRGKLIYIVQLSKKVGVRPSSPPPPKKK